MEKLWKIKNIKPHAVKVTVCVKPNAAPGVILKPNQFCLGKQQMTAPLDKQLKTKMVDMEEFENTHGLELAIAYDASVLDVAIENTESYVK